MELLGEEILTYRSVRTAWSETGVQFGAKQGVSINAKRAYTFAEMPNVIRHNYDGGKVEISLDAEKIVFANTGHNPALDPEKIFDRFYKDNASEGTGLGLAILKQICNRQDYLLNYSYHYDLHCFTIIFDPQ